MKPGGGKSKGADFEREICKKLSLWVSHGEREDLFWRSAMSGGRATLTHRQGKPTRQDGDICAVHPEGHALTDHWYVECKFVKKLGLEQFLIKDVGLLAGFWRKCKREADKHQKEPVMILKQNGWPPLILSKRTVFIDFNLMTVVDPVMLDWVIGGFEMNVKYVKWTAKARNARISNS